MSFAGISELDRSMGKIRRSFQLGKKCQALHALVVQGQNASRSRCIHRTGCTRTSHQGSGGHFGFSGQRWWKDASGMLARITLLKSLVLVLSTGLQYCSFMIFYDVSVIVLGYSNLDPGSSLRWTKHSGIQWEGIGPTMATRPQTVTV